MLHKVRALLLRALRSSQAASRFQIGLLPKDNPEQVPLAYKLYQDNSANSRNLAAGFKQTFCRSVTIDFVGVWSVIQVFALALRVR